MAEIFLGIGTNIDREIHLMRTHQYLTSCFDEVCYSPIYETPALGFKGAPFYNLVAKAQTSLAIIPLTQRLKWIEDQCGRDRSLPKFSSRTIDIDLLTYDQAQGLFGTLSLPRAEILERAFILKPLADLAGERCHPGTQQCYHKLWQDYSQKHAFSSMQPLKFSIEELCL